MPASWGPTPAQEAALNQSLPVANLSQAAEAAAREAYQELVEFISRPGMIEELDTDALEPIINGAFAGSNLPDIQSIGLHFGRDIWLNLSMPYLAETMKVGCNQLSNTSLAMLVGYGGYLQRRLPGNATFDAAYAKLSNLTQSALDDCGTLEDYLGFDPANRTGSYPKLLDEIASDVQIDEIFDMVLQAVDTLGLSTFELPTGTLEYTARFWRYLFQYPFVPAGEYNEGLRDESFEQNSYIVTHAAYIPTGYQRYRLEVRDAPWLFHYLRENFYAVMELGSLDLLAEFVDVFRQYNCTEENDAQTRDGTQFMLGLYEKAGRRWTSVRESREVEGDLSSYDLMHKPWTAYVGLHARVLEAPLPGTYGAAAREAVERALRMPWP